MSKISKLQAKTPMQKFFKRILQSFHKEDFVNWMNELGSYCIGAYSTDYQDIRIFFYYYNIGSWDKDIDFGSFLMKETANKEIKIVVEIINDNDRKKDKKITITETDYKLKGFEYYRKQIQEYIDNLLKEQK